MSEPKRFGKISFSGKDIAIVPIKFNRIAIGQSKLYAVSLVSETQRIKAVRSMLNGGAKVSIEATDVQAKRPSDDDWNASSIGRLYATEEGYNCYTQKLDYGMAHALFITRMPGFMPVVSDESLWMELNDVRFTTPILREWLPYIEQQLRLRGLLEDASVFGEIKCGVLNANIEHLDDIVSSGIKLGYLEFSGKPGKSFVPLKKGDHIAFAAYGRRRTGEVVSIDAGFVTASYQADGYGYTQHANVAYSECTKLD